MIPSIVASHFQISPKFPKTPFYKSLAMCFEDSSLPIYPVNLLHKEGPLAELSPAMSFVKALKPISKGIETNDKNK